MTNNIFYGNLATQGNSVALTNSATGTISYCDAFPDPGGPYVHYYGVTPRTGCMYVDPVFCGSANHPYWLQSTSTIRGQGLNPGTGSPVPTVDKDGRPRPGTGTDNLTDMGAYEDNLNCQ